APRRTSTLSLHDALPICAAKPRWAFDPNAGRDTALEARVRELARAKLAEALGTPDKHARATAVNHVFEEVWAALGADESKKAQADRKSTRLNSSHEWISY